MVIASTSSDHQRKSDEEQSRGRVSYHGYDTTGTHYSKYGVSNMTSGMSANSFPSSRRAVRATSSGEAALTEHVSVSPTNAVSATMRTAFIGVSQSAQASVWILMSQCETCVESSAVTRFQTSLTAMLIASWAPLQRPSRSTASPA